MKQTDFEKKLKNLDLTDVLARVQMEHGISDADAERAEDLYRKYLTLHYKYPTQMIVPTVLVDRVWHSHILFTRKYMEDCKILFGKYLHHTPNFKEAKVYFMETKALYKKEFDIELDRCGVSDKAVLNGLMLNARCK